MLLPEDWILGLLASIFLTIGSLLTKKIDLKGAIAGGCITFFMFLGSGWLGIVTLTAFFVLGTMVSQWKKQEKKHLTLAQENEGKRTIVNAIANGGVAGLSGLWAWIFVEEQLFFEIVMMASIASACSDTFSSELGNVYGKRYINILTFRSDKRGLDGVISLEGLMAGVVGSSIIALIYLLFRPYDNIFWIILIGGMIGNLSDSILGATVQRKNWLDNHQVNFFSTLIAGFVAYLLIFIFL